MVVRGKNMFDLKQSNRSAILHLLHGEGGMSRKQIAAKLNLTPSAITMIVSEMIEAEILQEVRVLDGNGSAGRKEIMVDICTHRFFAVGVYYGVESSIVSVTNVRGEVLESQTFLYEYESGATFVIDKICNILSGLIEQYRLRGMQCVGVGVSARGIVDDEQGICHDSYGGWPEKDVNVCAMVRQRLGGVKVVLQQNVRALAQAYTFRHPNQQLDNMLFVTNDTGIGGTYIINRGVYMGSNSNAAELGHVVVDGGGKPCRCGSQGCLETVASCRSIERDIRGIFGEKSTPVLYSLVGGNAGQVNFSAIVQAAKQSDTTVNKMLDHAIQLFAQILRVNLDLLDLQKLILHGMIFSSDYYLTRLLEEINFDGRYTKRLHTLVSVTEGDSNLNASCSPLLAVGSFFASGGLIGSAEQN